MTLVDAVRFTEILLAVAFIQQAAEHMVGQRDEVLYFAPRLVLGILLLFGIQSPLVCIALLVNGLFILNRFQGPYNGGSDLMGLLITFCLALYHVMPEVRWQEYVFAYLALQVTLSYFKAGWSKVVNPDWRSGRALGDVFAFSAYPASESLRSWALRPRALLAVSWAVIAFELAFPVALLSRETLIAGLAVAATFHIGNALFLGFNRFVWVWIAAYPSVLWLQHRLFAGW